jgi:hypothetical protein
MSARRTATRHSSDRAPRETGSWAISAELARQLSSVEASSLQKHGHAVHDSDGRNADHRGDPTVQVEAVSNLDQSHDYDQCSDMQREPLPGPSLEWRPSEPAKDASHNADHTTATPDGTDAGPGGTTLRRSEAGLAGRSAADIPGFWLSSCCGVVVSPRDVFVVEGAGFQAAVQDADVAVGQSAQRGLVADVARSQLVVVGAGPGRSA